MNLRHIEMRVMNAYVMHGKNTNSTMTSLLYEGCSNKVKMCCCTTPSFTFFQESLGQGGMAHYVVKEVFPYGTMTI